MHSAAALYIIMEYTASNERQGNMATNNTPRHEETIKLLQDLIRFDTSNPPGNETPCCEYIKEVFAKEGIESEIYESAPGRGSILARLKGDGSKKPLMITSHVDVVPADASKWKYPPFGADIAEDCLWGRGSLDTKNLTAVEMVVMMELVRRKVSLKRDVIFLAVADEEQSGAMGMGYMVREHFDKIDCEFSINEGGGVAVEMDGKVFYFVQTAEKGVGWYKLTTNGPAGHGSVPKQGNALVKMSRALMRLSQPQPVSKTRVVSQFMNRLASGLKFPKNLALPLVLNSTFSDAILNIVKSQDKDMAEMLSATVRDTISPTVIKAGYKENVIPNTCEAIIDCRILPGQTHEKFMKEVQRISGVDKIEMLTEQVPEPTESPANTELMRSIRKVLEKHDPGCITLPYMVTGATDSRFLRKKGIVGYGFSPIKSATLSPQEYVPTMHAENERMPLDGLRFSYDVLMDTVLELCT